MLATVRSFFYERNVLEVETPLLCQSTGTDPQLDFFSSRYNDGGTDQIRYLQTSPEFAMKRLLAAGSGSIYQICKAFRNGEQGQHHNPEFTLLEWYRVGFDMHQLMDEVAELLMLLLGVIVPSSRIERVAYRDLFAKVTGLDALDFCRATYRDYALTQGLVDADRLCGDEHALWLDFLFSHCLQPAMASDSLYLVYGFPAVQSSLARLDDHDPRVAQRFEVIVQGIELGNGFCELTDANEQEVRFDREIDYRSSHDLPKVSKDVRFLDALRAGLPHCSGVAIGLDRVLMLATRSSSLDKTLAFPFQRA